MRKYLYLLLASFLLTLSSCKKEQEEPIIDSSKDIITTNVRSNEDRSSNKISGIKEDYINTNRVAWQKPNVVIDFMGDISDKVVADIGAGTGFFSFRVAREAKKVIAIDIDPQMIEFLDSAKIMELPEAYQAKLEPRLSEEDQPNLEPQEADIIIIVNTYFYIGEDRVAYLSQLRELLPEGGKVLILDFKKKRTPLGPAPENRIPLYVVEENLFDAGFTKVETNDKALDYQYIVLAEK
jgi:SAM-dependent methyltransferase